MIFPIRYINTDEKKKMRTGCNNGYKNCLIYQTEENKFRYILATSTSYLEILKKLGYKVNTTPKRVMKKLKKRAAELEIDVTSDFLGGKPTQYVKKWPKSLHRASIPFLLN